MSRITTAFVNANRLDQRTAELLPAALQAIHDALPGHPASVPGSGSVGGGGTSATSPTERLAGTMAHDPAIAAKAELAVIAARRIRDSHRAHTIVTAWTSTTTNGNTSHGDECCTSCERIHDFTAQIYRAGLCRFCYEYRQAEGTTPSIALLEARRANGNRVTDTMMRQARIAKKGRR